MHRTIQGDRQMHDHLFARAYPLARRAAAVRSAAAIALVPSANREDLEQQVTIALWLALSCYDPSRASLRTFVERVAANRMASLIRSLHHSGQFKEVPLENAFGLAAPDGRSELRTDVSRVLAGVSAFDRCVAGSLARHSAAETSRRMGVSRAKVYRAIGRLRVAFTVAGFADHRGVRRQEVRR
jgi:DNA-directed RNA polymerase specialized sigma24 family protein